MGYVNEPFIRAYPRMDGFYTKTMKLRGYLKFSREDIEVEKDLSDRELRLLNLFVRIVDWDPRHKERFASARITVAEIHRSYLPHWCTGKIWEVTQMLINKGQILRLKDGRIQVVNFTHYLLRIPKEILPIHQPEIAIHRTEGFIQAIEKQGCGDALDKLRNNLENKGILPKCVHQNEQKVFSKETKETIKT